MTHQFEVAGFRDLGSVADASGAKCPLLSLDSRLPAASRDLL